MARGSLCAQRAQSHAKRAQRALRAPLPCFLLYTAVKIGINVQLDMANGQRVFVREAGTMAREACAESRAKRAQNHARSVRRITREACAESRAKRAQRALQAPFPCFLPYTAVKIGINIQLDMAVSSRVFVSRSCVRSEHNCVRSMPSELCEHHYRVSCFIQL